MEGWCHLFVAWPVCLALLRIVDLEGCSWAPPALRIGQVAEASGLLVKTVRFYCDESLIAAVSCTQGDYRLFHPAVVCELVLVRSLCAMNVPLSEIKRLLGVCHSCY